MTNANAVETRAQKKKEEGKYPSLRGNQCKFRQDERGPAERFSLKSLQK